MFVYNKQKSQSIVSSMLEQVEIDASKIQRVKTSRNIESKKHRIQNYNREKYNEIKREEYREKTCNELKRQIF